MERISHTDAGKGEISDAIRPDMVSSANGASGWRGLFVTGTDTGVGKTLVTAAITAALRQSGVSAGVWKPVQSGVKRGGADSDAHLLRRWSGTDDPPESIAPFSFEAALTPSLAARAAGVELTLERLLLSGLPLARRHEALLVEGAGGVAAPLTAQELVIDLIDKLGLPVLIMARSGLGTVNHTLLTLSLLRQRRIPVAGVVLNDVSSETVHDDPSRASNGQLIAQYGDVPVLGCFPYVDGEPDPARLAHFANHYLQLSAIRAALK